jgi:hypothetical protein
VLEDTRLQAACARSLKAREEPEVRGGRAGYRPARGAGEAGRDRTLDRPDGRDGEGVEADLHGGFDPRDQGWRRERRRWRLEDRAVVGRLWKWRKAGMLETAGRVIPPDPGVPQGGVGSPG